MILPDDLAVSMMLPGRHDCRANPNYPPRLKTTTERYHHRAHP